MAEGDSHRVLVVDSRLQEHALAYGMAVDRQGLVDVEQDTSPGFDNLTPDGVEYNLRHEVHCGEVRDGSYPSSQTLAAMDEAAIEAPHHSEDPRLSDFVLVSGFQTEVRNQAKAGYDEEQNECVDHAPKNPTGERVALGAGVHFLAHGEVLSSVRVVSMCDWARWEGCFEEYLGLQTVVAREVQSGTAAHGPDLEQGPNSSGAVEQH